MPGGELTSRVITKLKKVCREQGLTPSDVYEKLPMVNGQRPVSLSTVRRVLADGSENAGFRYYDTIQPITAAVLGTENIDSDNDLVVEPFDTAKAREYYTERNALQEIVRLRSAEEDRLRERLEAAGASAKEELARLSFLHDQNINRLLALHQAHDDSQATVIRILEQNNAFLQQTLERAQRALQEEREAKKRMYDDYKRIVQQEIEKLKAYHEEGAE